MTKYVKLNLKHMRINIHKDTDSMIRSIIPNNGTYIKNSIIFHLKLKTKLLQK